MSNDDAVPDTAVEHEAPYECELCGQPIYTEWNLAPIENGDGETVQGCPGCHGAAGGG